MTNNQNSNKWLWPCPHTKSCSQLYTGAYPDEHSGLDIRNGTVEGKPVIASRSGQVAAVFDGCGNYNGKILNQSCSTALGCDMSENTLQIGPITYCNQSLGNAVKINHGDGQYSHYVHFERLAPGMTLNKQVKRGEVIGYVGSTGESEAPHLHFSLATGPSAATRYYNNPIWKDKDDGIDYVSSILVTFDPDGGQCDTEHFGYGTGETYEWLPTPTDISGRTFSGWYTENGTKVEVGDTVGSTSMTLTARWENATVSVTYDLDGGSWSLGTSGTLTVTNGKITLPATAPAKTGYTFAGWTNGGVTYQPGAEVSVASGTTAMTFEATYTPKPITVTFNASNGLPVGVTPNISENSLTVNFDSTLSSDSLPVPDCNGRYDFVGWYADSACTVSANGYKVETTGTLTLYAKWTCFVRIEAGATGMSGYPLEITGLAIGAQFELPVTVPVHPDGWYFKGYDCSYNGVRYYHGENVTITENTVFYITWEEPCVYLKLEHSDTVDIASDTVEVTASMLENGKIPCSLLPSAESFGSVALEGWRIKGDESGTVYSDTNSNAFLPEFKNYTLIAKEQPVPYAYIEYDANGGTNPPSGQTLCFGNDTFITKDIPVREDHHFLGWAESADSITPVYTPGSLYNGTSATLYAVWIGGCYVLRFDTGASTNDDAPVYGIPMPVTYAYMDKDCGITLPATVPERHGYRFLYWEAQLPNQVTSNCYPGDTFKIDGAFEDSMMGEVIPMVAVWVRDYTNMALENDVFLRTDTDENGEPTSSRGMSRRVMIGGTYGYASADDGPLSDRSSDFENEFLLESYPGAYYDGWGYNGNFITPDTVVEEDEYHVVKVNIVDAADYDDLNEETEGYGWAKESVSVCKARGIMSGVTDTTFLPGENVPREMAATVIYKLEGQPEYGTNHFYDVSGERYYNKAVTFVYDNGIMSGVDTDRFGVGQPILRKHIAKVLYTYAGLKGIETDTVWETDPLAPFTDGGDDGYGSYTDAFRFCVGNGIMTGTSETALSPDGALSRAQLAVLICRLRKMLINEGIITKI